MMRIVVAIGSVCLLAACSHPSEAPPSADITKIAQVKSDFAKWGELVKIAGVKID